MPKPTPLTTKLKGAGFANPHAGPPTPVWKGPEEDGITFSLLSRFLVCRERFRLLVVEGLRPIDAFNHRLEFGQMWHVCEEGLASGLGYERALLTYAQAAARRYPTSQNDVQKWYHVTKRMFPLYVEHWAEHPDVQTRQPLLQEEVFNVPYRLPSGRTVRLRGKWDSVDLIGEGKARRIWLQENKTKGDIDEVQIKRQLHFDLQTMLYLTALSLCNDGSPGLPELDNYLPVGLAGVVYNVVRRPLSGGKGSIVQSKGTTGAKCSRCKGTGQWNGRCMKCGGSGRMGGKPPETDEEYYDRLIDYVRREPETFFMRWKVEISPLDIARFRTECLDPVLEQLCDWWDYVKASAMTDGNPYDKRNRTHWRHPFGVWNVLDEGGSSELDEYLSSGNMAGLARTANLYPELS